MPPRRVIILLVKAAFSIALIALVARRVDLGAMWSRLGTIKPGFVVIAGALIVFQIVVGSERWKAIMAAQGARVGSVTTLRIYYIGVFFNMCTPGGLLGDVVRIWHAHRVGLTVPLAISSVILDRVVVAVSLVFATASAQYLLPAAVRSQFQIGGVLSLFTLAALASIIGLIALMLLDRLPAVLLARWPLRGLSKLSLSARMVLLRPNALVPVMLLALFSQVIICGAIYALALSLDINLRLLDCMILMPPVILLSLMPVSIGGWGVREGAMVLVLNLVGIGSEQALPLSVLVGLLGMVMSLPGCVLWIALPPGVAGNVESEESAAGRAPAQALPAD